MKAWLPYPLWDMAGIELWLNRLAAEGYELEKWSGSFWGKVRFREDPKAGHARYRLDPIGKGTEELRERAANYRELGWRFVEQIGSLYAVYRCDDPSAPDLYTDPESLGYAMKRLIRRKWLSFPLLLLLAAIYLWSQSFPLFTTPGQIFSYFILNFDYAAPFYLFLLLYVGGAVAGVLYQTVSLTRIRRKLLRGEKPSPRRPTYPELRRTLANCAGLAVFLLLAVLALGTGGTTRALAGPEEWNFPHVLLSETLPTGTELVQTGDNWEFFNRSTFSHSRLAPEQYDTRQAGLARLPDGTSRQCVLELDYVRALTPFLADQVYSGKVTEEWSALTEYQEDSPGTFETLQLEEVPYPGLDRLTWISYQFLHGTFPRNICIGQLGEQVFVLNLQGPEPEGALELLAERVAAQV